MFVKYLMKVSWQVTQRQSQVYKSGSSNWEKKTDVTFKQIGTELPRTDILVTGYHF